MHCCYAIGEAQQRLKRDEENQPMNIGEAAKASGVSTKMIRHYESIGLLPQAGRTDTGYRPYGEKDVRTIQFIRRSRDLGFPLEEIRGLIDLWKGQTRPSREVKVLAQRHLDFLDRKLEEIRSMQTALAHLVSCCQGDERPGCPILEGLAGAKDSI